MRATPNQFAAAMVHATHSQRSLADAVTDILHRQRGKTRMGCSHTTIGNLAVGKAKRVHPRRAAAIEKALNVPPGHIFLIETSHVQLEQRTA